MMLRQHNHIACRNCSGADNWKSQENRSLLHTSTTIGTHPRVDRVGQRTYHIEGTQIIYGPECGIKVMPGTYMSWNLCSVTDQKGNWLSQPRLWIPITSSQPTFCGGEAYTCRFGPMLENIKRKCKIGPADSLVIEHFMSA